MGVEHLRVPASKLNNRCDPDQLGVEDTDEIESLDGTIGQERALSALELALNIDAAVHIGVAGYRQEYRPACPPAADRDHQGRPP